MKLWQYLNIINMNNISNNLCSHPYWAVVYMSYWCFCFVKEKKNVLWCNPTRRICWRLFATTDSHVTFKKRNRWHYPYVKWIWMRWKGIQSFLLFFIIEELCIFWLNLSKCQTDLCIPYMQSKISTGKLRESSKQITRIFLKIHFFNQHD